MFAYPRRPYLENAIIICLIRIVYIDMWSLRKIEAEIIHWTELVINLKVNFQVRYFDFWSLLTLYQGLLGMNFVDENYSYP